MSNYPAAVFSNVLEGVQNEHVERNEHQHRVHEEHIEEQRKQREEQRKALAQSEQMHKINALAQKHRQQKLERLKHEKQHGIQGQHQPQHQHEKYSKSRGRSQFQQGHQRDQHGNRHENHGRQHQGKHQHDKHHEDHGRHKFQQHMERHQPGQHHKKHEKQQFQQPQQRHQPRKHHETHGQQQSQQKPKQQQLVQRVQQYLQKRQKQKHLGLQRPQQDQQKHHENFGQQQPQQQAQQQFQQPQQQFQQPQQKRLEIHGQQQFQQPKQVQPLFQQLQQHFQQQRQNTQENLGQHSFQQPQQQFQQHQQTHHEIHGQEEAGVIQQNQQQMLPWVLAKVKTLQLSAVTQVVEHFLLGVVDPVKSMNSLTALTKRPSRLQPCKSATGFKFSYECYMSGRFFMPGSGQTDLKAQYAAAENALVACLELKEKDGMSRLTEWRNKVDAYKNLLEVGKKSLRKLVSDPPGDSKPWTPSQTLLAEMPNMVRHVEHASEEELQKIKKLTKHPWQILEEYAQSNRIMVECNPTFSSVDGVVTWEAKVFIGGDEIATGKGNSSKMAKRMGGEEAIRAFCPQLQNEMLQQTLAVEAAFEKRRISDVLKSGRYSQSSEKVKEFKEICKQLAPKVVPSIVIHGDRTTEITQEPVTPLSAMKEVSAFSIQSTLKEKQSAFPCELERQYGSCTNSLCIFKHEKPIESASPLSTSSIGNMLTTSSSIASASDSGSNSGKQPTTERSLAKMLKLMNTTKNIAKQQTTSSGPTKLPTTTATSSSRDKQPSTSSGPTKLPTTRTRPAKLPSSHGRLKKPPSTISSSEDSVIIEISDDDEEIEKTTTEKLETSSDKCTGEESSTGRTDDDVSTVKNTDTELQSVNTSEPQIRSDQDTTGSGAELQTTTNQDATNISADPVGTCNSTDEQMILNRDDVEQSNANQRDGEPPTKLLRTEEGAKEPWQPASGQPDSLDQVDSVSSDIPFRLEPGIAGSHAETVANREASIRLSSDLSSATSTLTNISDCAHKCNSLTNAEEQNPILASTIDDVITFSSVGNNAAPWSTAEFPKPFYSPRMKSEYSSEEIKSLFSIWGNRRAAKRRYVANHFQIFENDRLFEETVLKVQDIMDDPNKDNAKTVLNTRPSDPDHPDNIKREKRRRCRNKRRAKKYRKVFQFRPVVFHGNSENSAEPDPKILANLKKFLSMRQSAPWCETSSHRYVSHPLDTSVFDFSVLFEDLYESL